MFYRETTQAAGIHVPQTAALCNQDHGKLRYGIAYYLTAANLTFSFALLTPKT